MCSFHAIVYKLSCLNKGFWGPSGLSIEASPQCQQLMPCQWCHTWLVSIPIIGRFLCCCHKSLTKTKLKKKWFVWFTFLGHTPSQGRSSQAKNSKQELKQRPWRSTSYRFTLHGSVWSAWFLPRSRTTCPGVAQNTEDVTVSHESLIKND